MFTKVEGTWENIISLIRENEQQKELKNEQENKWIYRGMLDTWDLETTLERACRASKVEDKKRAEVERNIIREFKRKYNHIATPDNIPPPDADTIWWLSVMQHHGAPTRLLDWTYSPYIAAYFAFECKFNELAWL